MADVTAPVVRPKKDRVVIGRKCRRGDVNQIRRSTVHRRDPVWSRNSSSLPRNGSFPERRLMPLPAHSDFSRPPSRSFSSLLGLKNGISLAGTSTRSPVLGLRPTRDLRWRVRKLPNPRISILSPARNERTTLSKMVSTMTSLSFRLSSARRETSSIKSALVISHAPYRETNRLPTRTTDTLSFVAGLASLSFRWTSLFS